MSPWAGAGYEPDSPARAGVEPGPKSAQLPNLGPIGDLWVWKVIFNSYTQPALAGRLD